MMVVAKTPNANITIEIFIYCSWISCFKHPLGAEIHRICKIRGHVLKGISELHENSKGFSLETIGIQIFVRGF